ncbi:MAG: hypothetical protein OHK006_13220 [Thermodesulfovibrionales bacterium]
MSCEACRDILEVDGVEPDCFDGRCLIPDPGERGTRILQLRGLLIRLHELTIGPEILRLFQADIDDLELLATVEDELKAGKTDQ